MKTLHTIYTSFAKRLAIILTLLLTLGVTSVLAAEYEEMLVLDVAKNAPTGSTTTAMEADAILSYLENASETNNEIKSVTDVSGKVYKGKGTGGDGIPQACLKIGKASEAAGFTFTIADTFDDVSKVTIIGYGWKTSTAVSVNESAKQEPTSAATEVSFDYILASPTKTIKIYVGSSAFCATQIILYKEAAPSTFTVTYDANGATEGSVPKDNTEYASGESVTVLGNTGNLVKDGYNFDGWQIDKTGTVYTAGQTFNISSNVTLYAKWSEKSLTNYRTTCTTQPSYSVTIADNIENGEVTANPTSATAGTEIALTATPTNGYQFSSWIVTKEGGGTVEVTNNKFTMPASNVTVSATFTALPKHTITWSVNGTTQSLSPFSVTDGNNLGTLPTPNLDGICEGKTFVGWTTEANNNYFNETTPPLFIEATTQPEGNTTYYAVFATQEQGGTKTITFSDQWTEDIDDLSKQTGGYKFCDDIITLTFAKPVGQTNPAYKTKNNAVRLYYGNTMKVSSTSTIQTITLTFVSEDANTNSISTNPDCGTLPISSPHAPHTWTINDQEVTFQIGTYKDNTGTEKFSGHRKISKIDIVTADGGAASYSDYTTSCGQTYTITWKNYDGTVLKTDNVLENTMPKYTGENPTKASTAQYTYTFNGWTPEIVAATKDATYTATYTETLRNYTITWKNGETTLETDNNVPYGETPSYNGATPTKAATAQYTYTFKGWDPEVTTVTGDATYTATFTETLRTYTITWKNDDGTTLETDENVPYGTTPSYDSDEPTKTATAQHSYDFNGWNPTITTVSGDATYTAKYTAIVNIIWMVNGKQQDGSTTTSAGNSVQPPTVNPIPCGAVLAGWTDAENGVYVDGTSTLYAGEKPSIKVTENKTFYAVFADLEGAVPEMPTVIAYWENQALTKDKGVSATIGTGTMTSNIGSTELRTKTAYFGNINTQPIIELINLDLTSHQDICLSFWTRGSAGGTFTIKTNDQTITTANINKNDETLYIIENIPSTTTSITLSYSASSGSFFFGTVKLYEAPATYSFEKLTEENTNGWTGSDWDGYYLITNGQPTLLALDGNAIFDGAYERVEDIDNQIEAPITMAFNVTYNSIENGYSLQGIGDGMYLNPTGSGGKEVGSNANAIYFPTIGYNQLKTSSNMFLSWNTTSDLLRFYNSSVESPQMYKIMSELSNYRTLCEYEVTWLVGGDEYSTGDPTRTVQAGKTITTLPTNPADNALGCCADKFMGWTTSTAKTIDDQYLYETIEEIQTKFPSIYEDLTFRAVFATTAQGVGTSIADFSEMGYENGTAVTAPIFLGDGEGRGDATITLAKAAGSKNDAKYYDDGEAVRVYAGGTITIASTYNNATIKNIVFTFAGNDVVGENTITASSGTYDNGTWTGDASTVTFTIAGSTGHRRIASITVTTGVAGSQYTNYVTSCDKMNDPSLGAVQLTYNSGDAIAVNCGTLSSKNSAASITFPNAVNLTCPITVTAPAGFVLATNRQSDTYTQTVVIKPVKTGENKGKITKTVYVRADAPENSETDYSSNITITGEEITTTTVTVKADVTCKTYIFKTLTHIGDEHTSNTYYAGQTIEEAPVEPEKDDCSTKYDFAGWSMTEVAYGSPTFAAVTFPFVMPANDVTLYPVYICSKDYHRVTSDLGAENWAGDYLIAAASTIVADGSTSGLETINGANIDENIVPASFGDFYVSLIAVEGGYVLKTQENKDNDKPYVYITPAGNTTATTASSNTAGNNPLSVTYNSESNIVITNPQNTSGYALRFYSTKFGFFKSGSSIYLYKKYLYTSSLICETITAEDAMVTSTAGQTVKVNVTATMSGMTVIRDRTLTVESDNTDFAATITETATNTYNVAVSYTPSVEDITDDTETATITIKVNDNPVTTFQVTGRHLPENFVIAAKAGGEWVALTAKVSNGTQVAVPIIVDDKTAPTKAIVALNTCQYKLLGLTTKNRFDVNGTAVHLYSTQTEKVLNASTATGTKTYLNTDANQTNAETSPNALFYEWKLVSKDLVHYTITNSNQTAGWENNRILGYSAATGMWGMYSKGTNINQDLFLLPVETVLTEIDMEVMEWGENSIALRIPTDAPEKIQVTLGENTSEAKALTNLNADGSASDLYKVEGLTLNSNDCEVMMITDADNTTQGTLVRKPIIITGEVESTTYTSDDCPHCDVVVLKDAKLKAGSSHLDFAKIYVYPGGKLVLDGNSLGVKQQVYLRGGYSWLNPTTYALPEVYLNGSVDFKGSGNIIYDYYIQNYKYYQFALPYDVQLAKVTDEAGIDNFPVWVKHYNGALRAVDPHATSWEWYPSENGDVNAYFKAGEGYIIAAQPRQEGNTANRPLSIIRFPLGNRAFNSTNGIETDLTITTTAHGINGYKAGTVTANNVGWNFIGNPFMSTWKGDIGYKQLTKHPNEANWDGTYDWVDADIKYITIMSAESGSDYAQYIASDTELKPFFPFYLQETADGGTGTINFAAANRIQKAPAMLSAETPREAFVQIEIEAESIVDQTGMFVGDDYSDNIDFDDYEKMFGSSTDKPKVWLMHEGKRMAFEAMTESKAAAYTAIGYRAPQTGKYMFAINEEASKLSDVEAVYLTDNQTGVTDFDLLSSAYEFESDNELYNDTRFTIHIVLRDESPGTTTGVGNLLHFNSEQPMKFIYQDKMYILQNGVIYDAMGKQVKTINK